MKHTGLALFLIGAWIGLSAQALAQTAVARVPRAVCGVVAILLLFLSWPAWAAPTHADRARKAVGGWLNRDPSPLGHKMPSAIGAVKTFTDATSTTLFHVVAMDGGGFVIVSGDDRIEPVVAFSPDGVYDDSTDNPLRALVRRDMAVRLKAIDAVTSSTARAKLAAATTTEIESAMSAAQAKWTELEDASGKPRLQSSLPTVSDKRVDALVESAWSQQTAGDLGSLACYNYYTPYYSDSEGVIFTPGNASNYPCGCVATAMAQLMRFYSHPTSGPVAGTRTITVHQGDSTATTLTVAFRGGDGNGGAYDWSNMPWSPGASTTDAERQAIGALTYDAGVSVNMDYASDGSTAFTSDAPAALTRVFHYSKAIYAPASGSIPSDYLDMINPNLDAAHPVLFSIWGSVTGGHSIVCDGYGYESSTLYHHLNMGWSGSDNFWYDLSAITCPTQGYNFSVVTGIVYNVHPSETGEIISGRALDKDDNNTPIPGVTITATAMPEGKTYTATSNEKGIYALKNLPSNTIFKIEASKSGYQFTSQTVVTGESVTGSEEAGNVWGVDFVSAYQIKTLDDLVWLHEQAAAGLTTGKHYKQMNDIDASATATWNDSGTDTSVLEGFDPIGGLLYTFNGVFDGAGHKITGLVINRSSMLSGVGLFRCLRSGGRVQNLGLVGGSVTGSGDRVGGLVGFNDGGTITECYATGAVTGDDSVGGLVGFNDGGTITECYATGAVTGSIDVGGLVGMNNGGTVSACYATGSVTGSSSVGGLIGYNNGTVSNCHATGAVTGSGDYVGGLIGDNNDTVSECYATGAVTGGSWDVGGLAGGNSGTVSASYATGAVTGGGNWVGGLVGSSSGTISECYATGPATGSSWVGGLVGYNNWGTISECSATGSVTGSSWVGGLVGSSSDTISECYATGTVTGSGYWVGGLVGYNSDVITGCYATGAVTGGDFVGGLVGMNNGGTVLACYATGAVTGTYYIGGLVGENAGTISQCYATGAVTGDSWVGGLVGVGTISGSYWNAETTGQSSSGGGTGKTTAEMMQQATYIGWDFSTGWGIQGAYPYLADLTTSTLTYSAGEHGRVGDGTTTGTALTQTINEGAAGVAVTAVPNAGYKFTYWSDGRSDNPRTDTNVTSNVNVMAIFDEIRTAAREWPRYR